VKEDITFPSSYATSPPHALELLVVSQKSLLQPAPCLVRSESARVRKKNKEKKDFGHERFDKSYLSHLLTEVCTIPLKEPE